MFHADFPPPLVDPARIIPGGPPPDGIPPIDDPEFVDVTTADGWLATHEPVVYVQIDEDVRAYPVQILMWHEIVNDTVGGVPITVSYCPLCNSAVSFRREVRGSVTTFGTSGRLYASALVMYDRATESLWTHFNGRAVVGVLAGEELERVSSPLLGWTDFKTAFPEAMVLDRDSTGRDMPYGENPYPRYDSPASSPLNFSENLDDRAAAKQRVVGVEIDGSAKAWALEAISDGDALATNTSIGDEPIVILWKSGQASALESQLVVSGRNIGSVAVFSRVVDGETLTFRAEGDELFDDQTSSQWDITGGSVSGRLGGKSLERINHLDTFWFAWSTYWPESDFVQAPRSPRSE